MDIIKVEACPNCTYSGIHASHPKQQWMPAQQEEYIQFVHTWQICLGCIICAASVIVEVNLH